MNRYSRAQTMADNKKKSTSSKNAKKRKDSKATIIVFAVLCVALVGIVGALLVNKYANTIKPGEVGLTDADGSTVRSADNGIEISNAKTYVAWVNEVYNNSADYLGKKITIDGMFKSETYENNPNIYYYVYRIGPGCCGNDGTTCGFEFTTQGEYPEQNEWIKVTGTLDSYEEQGQTFLTLKDSEITVMEERGVEQVQDNSN